MTISEKSSILITQVSNGFIVNHVDRGNVDDESRILVFRYTYELYEFLYAQFDGEINNTTQTITNS
jgi:hypothetical protein